MGKPSAEERRAELVELYHHLRDHHDCPLKDRRTKLVFGAGNADADIMFVGEAPGAQEDLQGLPFVGPAGKLLEQLLGEIGLERADVFIANTLKCLRYNARVQLGDGSWERIGRLVRNRYSGEVMSVSADGRLVRRKVIGWYGTPLGERSVFRLRYRSAQAAGRGLTGIFLTGDHPVLTERGYVPAAELRGDDRVATGQGLSDLARDLICGTLLGDGTIARQAARLAFTHGDRQAAYAGYKRELLEELGPSYRELEVPMVAGGEPEYPVVQVHTRAHRAVRILRHEFYGARKRVPSWLASDLNDRMLAFWFMDDGHLRVRPPRRPSAEIAAVGFSDEDRAVLLEGLFRLGLPAKVLRGRFFFDVHVTETLSRRIAPYVPRGMRYKLHPDVERTIPFDPKRVKAGPLRVMFDEVEVEDVSDRHFADRTWFCIDVEDTHNFVTAGGVVHNCRPPGNRDPLPQEIEECTPHLMRQIELIQPKVICTLGNYATKLLTGSQRGITKVHGEPQRREIGGRMVALYPLFHPAAALRSTSVLELLRADIHRLPELIAEHAPEPEPDEEQLGLFG